MKHFFLVLSISLLLSHVQSDLLDGHHDHHHDHHHHDDDFHDDLHDHIEDQLEDHFERDFDDPFDSDSDELHLPPSAVFINELGGFLPSQQVAPVHETPPLRRGKVVFPDFSPPPSAKRTFDVSQFDFREPEPLVNSGPIVFPDFSPPAHSSVHLAQEPEIPHHENVVTVDLNDQVIPEIQLIDNFAGGNSREFLPDDSDELAFLPPTAAAGFGPAPHHQPAEPIPPPIPEVTDNFIGGQGRQLGFSDYDTSSEEHGEFPHYAFVPVTSFSCADQPYGGYFADPETECQVFHVCLNGGLMGSFLCPNQTVFNQQLFVCDWWFNVDCGLSLQGYDLNSRIGTDEHFLL